MSLKEPTPCCESPTLIWIKGKAVYKCPCGKFEVSASGRPTPKTRQLISEHKKQVR